MVKEGPSEQMTFKPRLEEVTQREQQMQRLRDRSVFGVLEEQGSQCDWRAVRGGRGGDRSRAES